MPKNTIGDRGKWAEKQLADILEDLNNRHMEFAYDRLPDARAAGGRLKAQLCDFIACYRGRFFEIEVKETEHTHRLAKDKISQMPRMRKWQIAGAHGIVAVYHSTLDSWRVFDLVFLKDNPPSWDLTVIPLYASLKEALRNETALPV